MDPEPTSNDARRRLMIVDDDAEMRALLAEYFRRLGFDVAEKESGAAALQTVATDRFDCFILDVAMPEMSGIELLKKMRDRGIDTPTLFLTAHDLLDDKVAGFEAGADDYLAKPFEPRELVLRIRNILQRRPDSATVPGEVKFGTFRFDLARAELFRGGDPVHLTTAETGLLSSLAQQAGQPVSREELSQSAAFSGNIRNVDVQMTRLRRKIEQDPRYPRYLQTVRGTGYVLKPE